MRKTALLLAALASSSLIGCAKTDPYTPPADASGEDIFYANCSKCHKPEAAGHVMTLSPAVANPDALIQKIHKGGMTMPAFPNIQGEPAQRLAEFILSNSRPK